MSLAGAYRRAPVPVQHLVATGYGARERLRRHRGPYRRFVSDLEVRQWWGPERLAEDQAARLRRLTTWCGAKVPYYRDLFADLGLGPADLADPGALARLPILDKEMVRAHPHRFRPDPPAPRVVAQTTGGTTGTPLPYWATLEAVRFNYATYEARTRRWAGVALGDRLASLHGQPVVPAEEQDGPFWRRNLAFNQLYLSVYHLSDQNLPAYVAELERFSPRVIAGYTSAVHRLAEHMLARGDVGRVRPAAVLVSSETLFPDARRDMETAFGAPVFNAYSLGELVAYVSECDHGELHISTEYGVMELVEGDGGTEIVATGLMNRGMPLLRYRTGDLATAAEPGPARCGRGLPRLAELTGRVDDVVRTPEGTTVGPAPMSLAFQTIPNLRRAQVRQDDLDRLTVVLEVTSGFGVDDEDRLRTELRRRLGPTIGLDLQPVETLPRTAGGKERLVVSSLGR